MSGMFAVFVTDEGEREIRHGEPGRGHVVVSRRNSDNQPHTFESAQKAVNYFNENSGSDAVKRLVFVAEQLAAIAVRGGVMKTPATAEQTVALLTASLAERRTLTVHDHECLKEQLWFAKAALKQARKDVKTSREGGAGDIELDDLKDVVTDAKETVEQLKALIEARR